MAREGLLKDWNIFKEILLEAGMIPTFAPRADALIEAFCRTHNAWLLNSTDKIDSWNTRPTQIHRVTVHRNRNTLQLTLIDDTTGRFVFRTAAHEAFTFGGVHFPAINVDDTATEPLIAPDSRHAKVVFDGTLLVLALDASGSMLETNSYDGRPKSEHLNEVVKAAITRLRNSSIGEGLYIAILRFSDDVIPLRCSTGAVFASAHDWFANLSAFDYLHGVDPGQTNIRLALQRSKEAIQNTISDQASVAALADEWRAVVVLITDGMHYVARADGTCETDENVALQALDIHEGLTGLVGSRIDVGCVGIGTDVNLNLLVSIASPCTALQRGMARRAEIDKMLLDDRLCISVDSNSSQFGVAIRTFIDVASSSY